MQMSVQEDEKMGIVSSAWWVVKKEMPPAPCINDALISKEKTYEMSILQTIDSKEYVCWSFRNS
jgi:hypothetical protein